MRAELDISVPRNGDYYQLWSLEDADGVASNLTSHGLALDIRDSAGSGAVIASATIEIDDPPTAFTVRIKGSDFDGFGSPTEVVRLPYDLKHTFPDAIVEVPVGGHILLIPEVTS